MMPEMVPIVIAVTGHRDIPDEDIPAITKALHNEFIALSAAHPHSPFVVLSGLAEGADRIAVRCALDVGWSLGAVLPLPVSEYERDFQVPASLAEFKFLLGKAVWVREVTNGSIPRPLCYQEQGLWMASQAQQLFAIWDGVQSDRIGGTAQVVKLFRERCPDHDAIVSDATPVIQIATTRYSNLSRTVEPGTVIGHLPSPDISPTL